MARSNEVQNILREILRIITVASHKSVEYQIRAMLHIIVAHSSMKRFLKDNIKFVSNPQFNKVFGDSLGLRGFYLLMSKNLSIAFGAPDDLDFIYRGTISTGQYQKPFIRSLLSTSMNYVRSLRKYA